MSTEIMFAEEQDEMELSEILWEYGMGIPGEIEEMLILKKDEQTLAGAKIVEVENNNFFLEVLGVKQDELSQGVGRLLITKILQNPWKCCKHLLSEFQFNESYSMTTVARGYAVGFYEKMGFKPCNFLMLPQSYREQCKDCPDKEGCGPVPMIFIGGIKS